MSTTDGVMRVKTIRAVDYGTGYGPDVAALPACGICASEPATVTYHFEDGTRLYTCGQCTRPFRWRYQTSPKDQ